MCDSTVKIIVKKKKNEIKHNTKLEGIFRLWIELDISCEFREYTVYIYIYTFFFCFRGVSNVIITKKKINGLETGPEISCPQNNI